MGFSGDLVVARSDGPLEEIPLFAALVGPHAPEAGVERAWLTSTGWQAVDVTSHSWDGQRLQTLTELAHWTSAPVSAARVLDSDCAIVTGLAPGGRPWHTALHIDSIVTTAEYEPDSVLCPEGMDPEEYGDRLRAHVPHAAADIAAWGAAAGFAAVDPALIEELLRAESVFVEETWDGVLEALGFPTP
jgi:hypothetical protein